MKTTPLSYLIDDMDFYRDIANIEPQYKVRAVDSMLRQIRQGTNFPWNLKKGTLRVFGEVFEYPIASDHDEMGFIEKQNINNYGDTARFFNTSIKQFYQIVNNTRNLMTDLYDGGVRMIGLNARNLALISSLLSNAETASDYTASDDASAITLDNVTFKRGNGSIQFTVTNSAGIATIKNTTNIGSDANHTKKYQFRWIYLGAVPTSIEMRFQTNDSNYLSTVVTTQFSGQALKANDWNLIAQDLNEATETGTFNANSIASEKIILNGAASGTYRVDDSNLREWRLLDYWYYSMFNVVTSTSSVADKQFFIDVTESSAEIDTTDKLLGDPKFFDYVQWGAMERLMAEIENDKLTNFVRGKLKESKNKFNAKFPNMTPLITTLRYRFQNDPLYSNLSRYRDSI